MLYSPLYLTEQFKYKKRRVCINEFIRRPKSCNSWFKISYAENTRTYETLILLKCRI